MRRKFVLVALLTPEKLNQSSGRRYLRARRPELYGKLVERPPPGHEPITRPGWEVAPARSPDGPSPGAGRMS